MFAQNDRKIEGSGLGQPQRQRRPHFAVRLFAMYLEWTHVIQHTSETNVSCIVRIGEVPCVADRNLHGPHYHAGNSPNVVVESPERCVKAAILLSRHQNIAAVKFRGTSASKRKGPALRVEQWRSAEDDVRRILKRPQTASAALKAINPHGFSPPSLRAEQFEPGKASGIVATAVGAAHEDLVASAAERQASQGSAASDWVQVLHAAGVQFGAHVPAPVKL
ncbi:hypothetical protein B0H19DRAFT_1243733 [Mycena capillaripes]|nr:hypothetical protein B0H19DRAFT_1243733 [Mycena capillaripes]